MADEIDEPPQLLEDVLQRHRKEFRDLTATVTSMKKQATKKTRKTVLAKCNDMQQSLAQRQKQELAVFNGNDASALPGDEITPESLLAALEVVKTGEEDAATPSSQPAPKRNRQKERLARRQAEIDRLQEEARHEALLVPDYKQIETDAMMETIRLRGLRLVEIAPDGNCLFSLIADQLEHHKIGAHLAEALRAKAGAYIQAHRTTFEPFMYNEETDALEDIDAYVARLTSTSMWGGDKEILALANVFACLVSVLCYNAALRSTEILRINEAAGAGPIHIAYYKHAYGLGEHYNSLRDESL